MSLTKLFNFKFMKQILKKSKGQLMIFLLLVPIFTFLSLLVTFSGNSVGVIEHEITIINFIGMYVIPVILSINLFNYIYKRASVDFINSMPISRKSIFFTPMVQDDPLKKPHSLVADFTLIEEALLQAMSGKQIPKMFI